MGKLIPEEVLPAVWADGSDVMRAEVIKLLERKAGMYLKLGNTDVADAFSWVATLVKVLKVDEAKKTKTPCGCNVCEWMPDLKCDSCIEACMDCQNCLDCDGNGEVGTSEPVECEGCHGTGLSNDF